MTEIIVKPLKNAGDISFGMSRSKVREVLGEYREFKKSKFSSNTTDDFNICHLYYNQNNECEAIEFFENVIIKIENEIVFPNEFDKICDILKRLDRNLEIEEESCTSVKYSIGVYAPRGKVEAILFGCEGYYN